MVAGLRADRGAVRALSERWVEQSLARGDTGRLLEPLLVSLLNPATARVSVLHASIKQSLAPSEQVPVTVFQFSVLQFPVLQISFSRVPITIFQV